MTSVVMALGYQLDTFLSGGSTMTLRAESRLGMPVKQLHQRLVHTLGESGMTLAALYSART